MMTMRECFLVASCLLAGSPAGAIDPMFPEGEFDYVAFTVQDRDLILSASELAPSEWRGEVGCCQVIVSPPESPGSLVTFLGDEIRYDPGPDYFGRDAIEYQVTRDQQTKEGTIRVFVAPRIVPLAGRWDDVTTAVVRDSFGFFDALTSTFHLCRADRATIDCGSVLVCVPYRLASASPGWLPLVGDWKGDGIDRPGLLDPPSRTLHLLDFPAGGYCPDCTTDQELVPAGNFQIGELGDVPLLGDWTGRGEDSIGLYRRARNEFYLHDFEKDMGEITGIQPTARVVSGFALPAAGVWPLAIELGGRHRLGLYDPRSGSFEGRDVLADADPTTLANLYLGRSSIAVAGDWLEKSDDQLAVYDRDTHYFESISRSPAIPPDGSPNPAEIYRLEVGWVSCYTMVARFPEDPDDPP